MWEPILNFLREYNTFLFILVILVGASVYLTVTICRHINKVNNAITKVNTLPCNARQNELDELRQSTNKLDSISEQLSEISKWVMRMDVDEIDKLAPKFSPRKMSKAGEELYAVSGAKKTLEDNIDYFIELLHEHNPQTALDVEDKAFAVLTGNMSNPIFNAIKDYIYFEPEKIKLEGNDNEEIQVTLSVLLLMKLMSIDLRDKYLEKYPIASR